MGQPRYSVADAEIASTCRSPVAAGELFPCTVTVRPGPGDPPPPLLVEVKLPPGVLHVGHDAGAASTPTPGPSRFPSRRSRACRAPSTTS